MPYSALNRAATSAWCTPSTVNVAIGSVGVSGPGPSTVTPGMAREPGAQPAGELRRRGVRSAASRCARARRWRRGGRPRRGRWGSRLLRVRAGRSTRPRRGRRGRRRRHRRGTGRRRRRRAAGRRGRRRRRARTSCGRSTRRSRLWVGERRWGASWAASTNTGTPRSWAAMAMSSIGGIQPVTLDAPRDRQQLRTWCDVEGRGDVVDGEGAVGPHSTNRRRATRAHGSRLAWCSTTVVTTTSSGLEAEPVGEVVDRLGGVAADDRHVVAVGGAPGEPQDRGARVLVGVGGDARLVAGAAVDARVPRQELVDP